MTKSTNSSRAGSVLGRTTIVAALLAGMTALPVSAAEMIPVGDDGVLFAAPGTITTVAKVDVDPAFVGRTCRLSVISENQASVHYGNNLLVTTGNRTAVIDDVEAEADLTVDLGIELVVGETITIELEMGPDKVSSLGFGLEVDCDLPEPTTPPAPETKTPEPKTPPTPEVVTKVVEPKTVSPKTVTPKTVTPKTVAPKTVAPKTVTPKTVTPKTVAPKTVAPKTVTPKTVVEPVKQPVTSTKTTPTVLGVLSERPVEAPAAVAIPAIPTYTG